MAEPLFLVPALLLLIAFFFALRRSLRVSRLVNVLPRLPITQTINLEPGLRLAQGRIETDQPLHSPFHQRACAYYAYRVEEPRPEGTSFRRLATGKDWADVHVRDETGRARIEARAALIRAPHETTTDLDHLDGLAEAQREFLRDAGIEARHLRRFQTLRIVEYTLEPGDEVHVLGAVEHQPDGKVFYRGRHSPLAVSQTRDAGLIPGLHHERMLFGVVAAIFLSFALLFLAAALV